MGLLDLDFDPPVHSIPADVTNILQKTDSSVQRFHVKHPGAYRGFVPSDYRAFCSALRHVLEQRLTCGNSFCEWGSGLGVATCIAKAMGFDAVGIEIDKQLVEVAISLADQLELSCDFVVGSFIPPGADELVDRAFSETDGSLSLIQEADDAYEQLDRNLEDFDIVYAFPWPNDESLTANIFERFGASGALLMTYHEDDGFRLRRKV